MPKNRLKTRLSLIVLLFTFSPFIIKAQYTQITAGPNITPAINYIYVGSLTMDPTNGANCQKIKISVLGGSWGSDCIGETVYYIANRGGLTVHQNVNGSSGLNNTTLKAFQNGTNTDLYLQISSATSYYAMAVSSYDMAGFNATAQNVTITTSANAPAGTDITSTIAYTPVMMTDASGNIAINSINPNGYRLAVKGTIHAQEVNVDLNNWADYVFAPGYALPSLAEVKTYIDNNHHLPDMPSAKTITENGLDIGEMDKTLVKKVEELTLYLIAKDEQIKAGNEEMRIQQQEIELLKQQIELINRKLNNKN